MNIIDVVVAVVFVYAAWKGWRRGFILQVFSLVSMFIGVWLAAQYGTTVGEVLRVDERFRFVAGFLVVMLAALLLVSVAGRMVRRVFRFAGFGTPDSMLGAAVAVVKYMLLLSVGLSMFDTVNADYRLLERGVVESSRTYRPVMELSDKVFPSLEWVKEQLDEYKKELNLKQIEKNGESVFGRGDSSHGELV